MLLVKVKNSQSETYSGYLFQSSFYVDDSITDGIKAGSFSGIKGDGTVAGLYGTEVLATLQYADATHAPVGVIYEESSLSQYTGAYDRLIAAETIEAELLKPYGNLEDRAIGLLRRGVFEISNTEVTKYRHFRTVDQAISAAHTEAILVAAGADITVTSADLSAVLNAGEPVWVGAFKGIVKTLGATDTVITMLEDLAASTYVVTAPSLIGMPVYLNLIQDQAGELPFTIEPTSGKVVGFVESTIAVRFDLGFTL